nr:uncharacterized protein DDB_G0290685-like [Procambarus clarkii]
MLWRRISDGQIDTLRPQEDAAWNPRHSRALSDGMVERRGIGRHAKYGPARYDGGRAGKLNNGGRAGKLNNDGRRAGKLNNDGGRAGKLNNDGGRAGKLNNDGGRAGKLNNDGGRAGKLNNDGGRAGKLNNGSRAIALLEDRRQQQTDYKREAKNGRAGVEKSDRAELEKSGRAELEKSGRPREQNDHLTTETNNGIAVERNGRSEEPHNGRSVGKKDLRPRGKDALAIERIDKHQRGTKNAQSGHGENDIEGKDDNGSERTENRQVKNGFGAKRQNSQTGTGNENVFGRQRKGLRPGLDAGRTFNEKGHQANERGFEGRDGTSDFETQDGSNNHIRARQDDQTDNQRYFQLDEHHIGGLIYAGDDQAGNYEPNERRDYDRDEIGYETSGSVDGRRDRQPRKDSNGRKNKRNVGLTDRRSPEHANKRATRHKTSRKLYRKTDGRNRHIDNNNRQIPAENDIWGSSGEEEKEGEEAEDKDEDVERQRGRDKDEDEERQRGRDTTIRGGAPYLDPPTFRQLYALDSTRFGSPRRLTRSLSDSSVVYWGSELAKKNWHHGLVQRSASADRLLYAPHRWYYARQAKREARQRALQAEREARLAAKSDSPIKSNIEILSIEGSIGGMELRDADGALLTSRPDEMEFTYEIQVGGDGLTVNPVGRDAATAHEAWESDAEGGDDDSSRRRRSRRHRGKDGQLTQERLSSRLEEVLKEKTRAEDLRQKLFNKARDLHEQVLRARDKRRQEWWTAWVDARRTGTQLEERQTVLRNELDALHRRIIGSIIKREPIITGVRDEPSRKANYKISVIRLRHEIEDLRRRVEAMEIKVEAEMKLRTMAQREVKTLRSEVGRKKANVALTQRVTLLRSPTSLPPDLLLRI